MKPILFHLILLLLIFKLSAQTTNIIILDKNEQAKLKAEIQNNLLVKKLYQNIVNEANAGLKTAPLPIEIIYYEGLLDTNPKRIETMKSFADIDYVISLIYASYGSNHKQYGQKAKEIILAWAQSYKPTGNPINENKFNAFYWGYYLFKTHFNKAEQKTVENWFLKIADKEMNRKSTPNNNWEAKRCKMIGIIGCITETETLVEYSVNYFQKYISTAYYADGTSYDLVQRDALHYHIGGLKPCLTAFINLPKFDTRFALYPYVSESNSSIKKSVEYVVPYATGEKQRPEWTNTKVQLDKERAAAGIAEYQPGLLFKPEEAYEMFELACYFNPNWISIFEKEGEITSWIGFLNSPAIRK